MACLAASLLVLIASAAMSPLAADDFSYGRRLFLDKAQCSYCHGWAGDGAGEPQSNGGAANLRNSSLARETADRGDFVRHARARRCRTSTSSPTPTSAATT